MDNNNLLLAFLFLVIGGLSLYYYSDKLLGSVCKCGKQVLDGNCEDCPYRNGQSLLKKMAVSCGKHLRAVVREDLVSAVNVREFLDGGDKRVVLLTNVDPENMINIVNSLEEDVINQIKVVGLSSIVVDSSVYYIVVNIVDGKLSSDIEPVTDFDEAFALLESTAREQLGSDDNSLVLYVDENESCDNDAVTLLPDESGMNLSDISGMPLSDDSGIETMCGGYRH